MRFLHSKGGPAALLPGLLALSLSCTSVSASPNPSTSVENTDDVDVAKVQAGGKIVLISSGGRGGGFRAIDDDHRTTFRFASDDPRPTLIVQLMENRPIHRVSTVVGSKSAKVDVYLLNELPQKPSDLDELKPVGSIVDPGVAHEASLEFPEQETRYVALRWTLSKTAPEPLNIAEVSAFTHAPGVPGALAAAEPPVGPPLLQPVSP